MSDTNIIKYPWWRAKVDEQPILNSFLMIDLFYVVGTKSHVVVLAHEDMMFVNPDDIWLTHTKEKCDNYAFLHNTIGPESPEDKEIRLANEWYERVTGPQSSISEEQEYPD